jgi:hypothetical protein
MNVAGGEEGVDARALGVFERAGGALDIQFHGTGERGDLNPGNSRLTASTA